MAVRRPQHLDGIDALVVPGGESTTMSKLAMASGLFGALRERLDGGMPAFGTCAGAILLATEVRDGRADQGVLGALDAVVRRNGYGSQLDSFETDLDISAIGSEPYHAVFIRAPVIDSVGCSVRVLARWNGSPVVVENDTVTLTTFHPELTGDPRLHEHFAGRVRSD